MRVRVRVRACVFPRREKYVYISLQKEVFSFIVSLMIFHSFIEIPCPCH